MGEKNRMVRPKLVGLLVCNAKKLDRSMFE